jgi:hypothetical protein
MELISQKTPNLLQDWSIGRAIAWLAKLVIFVLVPGLHQIACKRRILGGLLMVMYFVAEFAVENRPLNLDPIVLFGPPDLSNYDFSNFDIKDFDKENEKFELILNYYVMDRILAWVPLYISWFLLVIDVRKIERRRMTLNWFLIFACLTGAWFWPERHRFFSNFFVVQTNIGCPEICKNDIVAWHYLEPYHETAISGQLVAIGSFVDRPFMARVLPGTPQQLCDGELPEASIRPGELNDCKYSWMGGGKYRIDTGPDSIHQSGRRQHVYWTHPLFSMHTSFSRIGNTHKFFILNDSVTDAVGQTLFQIYNWTYLDPLNFIE